VDVYWEEHLDVVYRYALRLTRDNQLAHELTQETMLRAWRRRATLREPAAARVWLLRIATNLWTDWRRRKVPTPQLLQEDPPSRDPTITGKLIRQENVLLALAALDQLPPRQREVMHLVTVEQMSHGEVAAILGISVAAVGASLSAGRKELRERLRGIYEDLCGETRCPTNE
jgi:RNA polymerase sigma-70 factor (ECF subfamily)